MHRDIKKKKGSNTRSILNDVNKWGKNINLIIQHQFAYLDLALTFRLFLLSLLTLFFLHLALILTMELFGFFLYDRGETAGDRKLRVRAPRECQLKYKTSLPLK